jgi:hypothetical protein
MEERALRRPGSVVALLSNFWIQSPRHDLDRRRRLVLRGTGEVGHRRRDQGRGVARWRAGEMGGGPRRSIGWGAFVRGMGGQWVGLCGTVGGEGERKR